MSPKTRVAAVTATVVATIALSIAPASARILTSTGCIEWSSAGGCAVSQTCKVDTDARYWSCYTVPTNGSQPVIEGGRY
jgi:hypothetical protein